MPATFGTSHPRAIYAGVVNRRSGERIFPGPAPGSELEWGAYTPGAFPIAADYWRDLVIGDATWTPAKLDLDKDLAAARIRRSRAIAARAAPTTPAASSASPPVSGARP